MQYSIKTGMEKSRKLRYVLTKREVRVRMIDDNLVHTKMRDT